ncbi:MAG: glycosyltransferase [Bdellovibrionales bacterium]
MSHTEPQSNRKFWQNKRPTAQKTAVLHLAPDLEIGANAREMLDMAIQTHRAGWRPLAATAGGPWVIEAERAAIRHTEIPFGKDHSFSQLRSRHIVSRLIAREHPALIHAHGFEMINLATKLARKHKIPFLLDLTTPAPVTGTQRRILQRAATCGARFRVPTDYMAQHLRDDFKLETKFLYRVYPGVDLNWYEAVRVTPERIHKLSKLWRLPEQASVIIMATPFTPGAGHQDLLKTLGALKNKDIFLVLISHDRHNPGTRAKIEKMLVAYGLEGKVIMPELCTDWPAACWLASLVVATNTLPRGQAPELLAAQAIGRPVIVTDCGANAELVQKDKTAWVIPPEDNKGLYKAFNEALAMSPPRRIDVAIATRDFVCDYFPMDVWRDSLFEIYDAMLAQPMPQPMPQLRRVS